VSKKVETPTGDRVSEREVEVKGKVVSVGIDVHKHSWTVTVMVEETEMVSVSCPPEYRTLKKLLKRLEAGRIRVVYEAGPGGFALYDRLVAGRFAVGYLRITADRIQCRPPGFGPVRTRKKLAGNGEVLRQALSDVIFGEVSDLSYAAAMPLQRTGFKIA